MSKNPIFLSMVLVTKESSEGIEGIIQSCFQILDSLSEEFEIIIVDNGSKDETLSRLRLITQSETSPPNLHVYALSQEVDVDSAIWAGVENALGDYVVITDLESLNVDILGDMVSKAIQGNDVVFARNRIPEKQSAAFTLAAKAYNSLYKFFTKIDLDKDAPRFRLISRQVINFISRHGRPEIAYRYLPAGRGFVQARLDFESQRKFFGKRKSFLDSLDRGIQILVSTTRTPMRFVSATLVFGSVANVLYSIYVLIVALLADNVEPGWVSMSLQQSGMFFLISMVLLVLSEYMTQTIGFVNGAPRFYVTQEFSSPSRIMNGKLNLEEPIQSNSKDSKRL